MFVGFGGWCGAGHEQAVQEGVDVGTGRALNDRRVQILDRGVPIAMIVAIPGGRAKEADDERRSRLIREGVLRPGTGDARAMLGKPPLKLRVDLLKALDEELEDRF